jgi:16S rRNA (adenine1518-N6/adenine1519-N6)-dimethyltransferase
LTWRQIGLIIMVDKSLGQHWLYNRAILEEIADLAAYGSASVKDGNVEDASADGNSERTGVEEGSGVKNDSEPMVCVEIGPGLGTLTSSLLRRFEKVIAVEYDAKLAKNLPGSFPGKNLEVVNADILEVDMENLKNYVIAGNIPYYITSPILKKVLTEKNLAKRVVLLMQKEVAERILGEKETVLSLFVKNRAFVQAGPVVLKEEFTPPPKVDSQVLVLEPHAPEVGEEVFYLIRTAFRAPRKKLIHNLSDFGDKGKIGEILREIGLDENARPGDLHLGDYEKLSETITHYDATYGKKYK